MKLPINYDKASFAERRKAREAYAERQGQKCQCCGTSLLGPAHRTILSHKIDWTRFPKGFQNHPVHLHHDHSTGWTIGAVHAYCNAYLWQYKGE